MANILLDFSANSANSNYIVGKIFTDGQKIGRHVSDDGKVSDIVVKLMHKYTPSLTGTNISGNKVKTIVSTSVYDNATTPTGVDKYAYVAAVATKDAAGVYTIRKSEWLSLQDSNFGTNYPNFSSFFASNTQLGNIGSFDGDYSSDNASLNTSQSFKFYDAANSTTNTALGNGAVFTDNAISATTTTIFEKLQAENSALKAQVASQSSKGLIGTTASGGTGVTTWGWVAISVGALLAVALVQQITTGTSFVKKLFGKKSGRSKR